MLSKQDMSKRAQIGFFSLEDLVPQDHLLRQIDQCIDFSFIYELVKEKYDEIQGRPSLDPILLIKLPMIQYLFGIKSMRQTIKEIEVNIAYRWFLGLSLEDPVPHFSTFGKNYTRRFKGTDLFEKIFYEILEQCIAEGIVDTSEVFIDSTHIKAHANRNKKESVEVMEQAVFYTDKLTKEITKNREKHLKKPLKETNAESKTSLKKRSTTDPESGWFHKGEHKEVFAYSSQVACDKHGWILGYTTHPGNFHDSRTFVSLFNKLKGAFPLEKLIMDAGYKTPAIAQLLLEHKLTPIFPYKRPMTKKGYFKKHEYVYDDYYNCYICPNNKILSYTTTNRKGYIEYKSNPKDCKNCPFLSKCTNSKNHTKVITRHIWAEALETCEEIRHQSWFKELYKKRKETIERIFGTAKEFHGLRYTNQIGIEKMHMKIGLTFACLNMKKLAKIKRIRVQKRRFPKGKLPNLSIIHRILHRKKTNLMFV
ncbi:IS1182 family transposase [Enterococcus sp. AZ162]|uniref:IS1182 family transposase n=1 Tax=unclassified Enterococcus TaxID=2608891 RepID=UPI003F203DC0